MRVGPGDKIGVKEGGGGKYPPDVEIVVNAGIRGAFPSPGDEIGVNAGGGGKYPPPGVEIEVNAGGGGYDPPPGDEIEVNAGRGGQYREGECVWERVSGKETATVVGGRR